MALSKKKPRELSIKEKVMVTKQNESEEKSQRELSKIFGKSKTQIQNTLKKMQAFGLHTRKTYQMTERGIESFSLKKMSIH